ncbi:MAG: OmpH family outer membrane protein [Casimicrobium sp.]
MFSKLLRTNTALRAATVVSIACSAMVAFAQSPQTTGAPATTASARVGDIKIGFVNTQKILRESAPAQRASKKLEREFATRQAEVEKLAKRFRDATAAFDKEQLTLSDEARRSKQRELESLNRDLQRAQRELREDENLRMNEELAQLQERAQRVIQRIAEAEKFDLILQEAVFVSSRIDITDRVLKALAE